MAIWPLKQAFMKPSAPVLKKKLSKKNTKIQKHNTKKKENKHYLFDKELLGLPQKEIVQWVFGHCSKLYETQCFRFEKKKKKKGGDKRREKKEGKEKRGQGKEHKTKHKTKQKNHIFMMKNGGIFTQKKLCCFNMPICTSLMKGCVSVLSERERRGEGRKGGIEGKGGERGGKQRDGRKWTCAISQVLSSVVGSLLPTQKHKNTKTDRQPKRWGFIRKKSNKVLVIWSAKRGIGRRARTPERKKEEKFRKKQNITK